MTPSCSTPYDSSKMGIKNNRFTTPNPISPTNSNINLTSNSPLQFVNDAQLSEEELLLYSMMTLVFPTSTFTKNYATNKYDQIISIISQIIGVKYSNQSIRNYFHRVRTNTVKGVGKTKGTCRWIHYQANVESFLEWNKHLLEPALQGVDLDETTINSVVQQLKYHCTSLVEMCPLNTEHSNIDKEFDINYVNQEFEMDIMPKLTSKWSKHFNPNKKTLHIYQFGQCPGYAEREIELTAAGTWSIHFEGRKRNIDLDWADVPSTIKTNRDLVHLLDTVGNMKACQGCNFNTYKSLFPSNDTDWQPIFKTKDGTPAAFVDILMSKDKEKVIRSSKCLIFLLQDHVIITPNICEACKSADHYLRTMLSRVNNKNTISDSGRVRYDYMSKEELLNVARNSVKEMKYWKQKCQRLEEYRGKMTIVGPKTDADLQTVFNKMYEGVFEQKLLLHNPLCRWQGCGKIFENVEILYGHVKQHITKVDTVAIAPVSSVPLFLGII